MGMTMVGTHTISNSVMVLRDRLAEGQTVPKLDIMSILASPSLQRATPSR